MNEILKRHGWIQGRLPIYVSGDPVFTVKLVKEAHLEILQGGVVLKMSKIRNKYGIPCCVVW